MVFQVLSCSQIHCKAQICRPSTPSSRFHRRRPVRGVPAFSPRAVLFGLSPLTCSAHIQQRGLVISAAQKLQAKGFGKKNVARKKNALDSIPTLPTDSDESDEGYVSKESQNVIADEEDMIPEAVMTRMMKRIGVSVAIPIVLAVLSFPLLHYLRVVIGVDMPEWLPAVVSTSTVGTAGFALTYGILSTNWDPSQEGSLFGWNEVQRNIPVVWENFKGKEEN